MYTFVDPLGSRGASQTTSQNGELTDSKTKDSAATVTIGSASDVSVAPGMARMTFTSGKQAISGFTPEKDKNRSEAGGGEEGVQQITKVKKNLRLQIDTPPTTPSKEELNKAAGKKLDIDKPIARNASSSDLGAIGKSAK